MRFFLLSAFLAALASAQVPIPSRYDGFARGDPAAPLLWEIFGDLLCPGAWPTVEGVVAHYGPSNLRLVFHTFPLPYHHNSYFANQGMHVVATHNASAAWAWMQAVYDNQDMFGNKVTAATTPSDVVASLGQLAQRSTGMNAADFVAGINDPNMDWATRVSWKYACSRAVAGTPTFLVNGVAVPADSSWSVDDWRSVLDPLLAPALRAAPAPAALRASNGTCPAGQATCQYLPGKTMCCLTGESCIANVGCRC